MKNSAIKTFLFLSLLIVGASCKDDLVYSELVRDNRPAVPITFPGTTTHGFDPYIMSSVAAGGAIKFTLSIPASSGRTIKEITRVAAGATSINAANATTGSNYITAPIPGNGTTVDFTTTIAEFKTKRPTVNTTPPAPTATTPYTEIAFIFQVTLDDGSVHIATPVRVRITA